MRKLIAAVTVLVVTSAQAAEELKFGDVNYFLKQNQFNVSADISSTYYKEAPKGPKTFETRGILLETRYGYGITDKLNAYIGLDYAYDRETEDKETIANKKEVNGAFDNDGLANPLLALNYRILNQNESRYNLDFGLVGRFNIEDAERGAAEKQNIKDGNFADGRNYYEANLRMGRKWDEANEWQLAAGVGYNTSGEETFKATTGDEDVDLDSSMNYFVRATYQYRPVNEFMLLVSAQANQIGEFEYKNKGSNTKFVEEDHIDLDFTFRAKYMLADNFIANFHYGMSRNQEIDRERNGVNEEIRRRRENFYGLGVDFLF